MEAIAHSPEFAKKAGVPQSVGILQKPIKAKHLEKVVTQWQLKKQNQ